MLHAWCRINEQSAFLNMECANSTGQIERFRSDQSA